MPQAGQHFIWLEAMFQVLGVLTILAVLAACRKFHNRRLAHKAEVPANTAPRAAWLDAAMIPDMDILGEYGGLLAKLGEAPMLLPDSLLPYRKKRIEQALNTALRIAENPRFREILENCLIGLDRFLPSAEVPLDPKENLQKWNELAKTRWYYEKWERKAKCLWVAQLFRAWCDQTGRGKAEAICREEFEKLKEEDPQRYAELAPLLARLDYAPASFVQPYAPAASVQPQVDKQG